MIARGAADAAESLEERFQIERPPVTKRGDEARPVQSMRNGQREQIEDGRREIHLAHELVHAATRRQSAGGNQGERDADEVLVDVGFVAFELLRTLGSEEITAEAIPPIRERAADEPLAVVAVQDDDRVGGERREERRQCGVEARERAIVAGLSEAARAVLGEDLSRGMELPEMQEQKPRRRQGPPRDPVHELAAPFVADVYRRRPHAVLGEPAIEPALGPERARDLGNRVIPGVLQLGCERGHVGMQPVRPDRTHAMPWRIEPGEHRGDARRGRRRRGDRLRAPHAACDERVEVRCRHAAAAERVGAHAVDEEEEDVGPSAAHEDTSVRPRAYGPSARITVRKPAPRGIVTPCSARRRASVFVMSHGNRRRASGLLHPRAAA